jgi:hypothetical protein
MALSEAEHVAVRRHLGYNAAAEANYPFVETFFAVTNVLESLPSAAEDECRAILVRLADLEERLTGALGRIKAEAAGPIRLNPAELRQLRSEVGSWRRELSTLLGLPLYRRGPSITVA